MERKLTMEQRDELRNDYQTDDVTVVAALDDLDRADEEIAMWRATKGEYARRYHRLREENERLRGALVAIIAVKQ